MSQVTIDFNQVLHGAKQAVFFYTHILPFISPSIRQPHPSNHVRESRSATHFDASARFRLMPLSLSLAPMAESLDIPLSLYCTNLQLLPDRQERK